GALMFTRTLSMQGIVEAQKSTGIWLGLFQLPAFVIYLFSAIAETNRAPFDLPEAESELVGGFHTEYSGFRFSIFFIAEYANMVVVSAIAATVFLGGWYLPLGDTLSAWVEARPTIQVALGVIVFAAKVGAVLYLFFWLRWTFPRYRYDQLMDIGWKWMLPAALANVMLTAVVFVVGQQFGLVQRSGLFLQVSPVGKLYFVGMSLLSMIPILILLNIINRDTRMFNLRAQRTKIPFSTRYAQRAEPKPAPASEAESGA
ncbi:MAG TPA: NADH-quinone oxidoreductase subunit H, partial [Acidobacteriota bacterium]|nr:NADH-quinone oxidoreductase subunit H [Acidobacteriota bacterium]